MTIVFVLSCFFFGFNLPPSVVCYLVFLNSKLLFLSFVFCPYLTFYCFCRKWRRLRQAHPARRQLRKGKGRWTGVGTGRMGRRSRVDKAASLRNARDKKSPVAPITQQLDDQVGCGGAVAPCGCSCGRKARENTE